MAPIVIKDTDLEAVRCNLCHADDPEPLYAIRDLMSDQTDYLARFVRCRRCGLVYQNPRPVSEIIGQFYPDEYEPYRAQAGIARQSWLARTAAGAGVARRVRFVRRLRKPGRLLDVGCATGEFLHAMAQIPGWGCAGVEMNQPAAEFARGEYGLAVHTGALPDAGFAAASFDVITLWEVLEHLHDPAATLAETHRLLSPEGRLVLRLPNLDSWDARVFRAAWAGFDAPRHLYVFSPGTIRGLLENAGYRLETIDYSLGAYASSVISVNFWMTHRNWSRAARRRALAALRSPIFQAASAPFFALLSAAKKSATMTVVAAKPGE